MTVLRTPDARFANLPDYPFVGRYTDVDGLQLHYVDEGPGDGEAVLLLHGEPSWSYLYRFMIPPLADAGFRVIAPDLIGFGKSDKLGKRADYSYARHVQWMTAFVENLGLTDINLFCQDWGSLIGLRVAAENEARFARIVLANGGLPTGDQPMPKAFRQWQRFARMSPWFPIGKIIQKATRRTLSAAEVAAYDAPFPSERYKAAARAFPLLVPTTPDNPASEANRAAWQTLERWEKPFLTLFSDRDPITRGGERLWQSRVPGAAHAPHRVMKNGGHFLQEDCGPELAAAMISFCRSADQ
ncbi:MAG: haloalkane dehalogenase [Pseudomonadota bacterium]